MSGTGPVSSATGWPPFPERLICSITADDVERMEAEGSLPITITAAPVTRGRTEVIPAHDVIDAYHRSAADLDALPALPDSGIAQRFALGLAIPPELFP